MVDTRDLKSLGLKGCTGSSPVRGTTRLCKLLIFTQFTKSCFLYLPKFDHLGSPQETYYSEHMRMGDLFVFKFLVLSHLIEC